MKSPDLGDGGVTLNIAFLMLVAAISIVVMTVAVLALIRGSSWQPGAITLMLSSALSAAIALVKLFVGHNRR